MRRMSWLLIGALVLAACGDGSPLEALSDAISGGEDEVLSDDLDSALEELEVELSEQERSELEELAHGSDEGSATITIDGEPFEYRGISCGARSDFYEVTAIGTDDRDVQVRFSYDTGDEFFWDNGSVNLFTDDGTWASRDNDLIVGDRDHAVGAIVVYEDAWAPEGERGTQLAVDLEIRCTDGVEVRTVPAPEEEVPAVLYPDDYDVDPQAGFAGDHFDVEVPDAPGTAVLVVGGERWELTGVCDEVRLREASDLDPDAPQAFFDFGARFADGGLMGISTDSINVALQRHLGRPALDAPPDRVREWVQIGEGVGAHGELEHRVDAEGTVSDRRATYLTASAERIVVVSADGVITARGHLDGNQVAELVGAFEFGGRCDASWDPSG